MPALGTTLADFGADLPPAAPHDAPPCPAPPAHAPGDGVRPGHDQWFFPAGEAVVHLHAGVLALRPLPCSPAPAETQRVPEQQSARPRPARPQHVGGRSRDQAEGKALQARPRPVHGGQAPPSDPETTPRVPQGPAHSRKRILAGWSLAVNLAQCKRRNDGVMAAETGLFAHSPSLWVDRSRCTSLCLLLGPGVHRNGVYPSVHQTCVSQPDTPTHCLLQKHYTPQRALIVSAFKHTDVCLNTHCTPAYTQHVCKYAPNHPQHV